MSFKLFVLCATLAIARAGYLQPALRYAHAAPTAIPAPAPLTYTIPPTVRAEHLPPVVTTSYGYSTAHTPVPAPIIRAEPIHHAPVAFAAPAIHAAPIARVALPAPAPVAFAAPAIHAAPAPLAFAAPAPLPVPAPALGFAGNFGGSHLAFGRSYATGFGFGGAHVAPLSTGFGLGFGAEHFAPAPLAFEHGLAGPVVRGVPAPIGFAGNFGPAPLAQSSYGKSFLSTNKFILFIFIYLTILK